MKKNKLFYLCPFFILFLLLAGCSAITGDDDKKDKEEEVTKLAAPVLSPADKSSVTEDTVISMAVVPNDAAVFYTLDGTDPTMMNGYLYTGSCKLKDLIGFDSSKDTVTLQAKAYKNGYESSNSSSAIYTVVKDTGVYLDSLSFDNAVLSETFSKTKFAYTSTVANSVTSVKVKAVNSSAVIKVNGTVTASNVYSAAINLTVGINNVSVTVTSGTKSNTYAVTITRQSLNPSSDATLSSLSLTNAALAETFDKTKLAYTSSVPYTTTSVTVNVSASSPAATVKIAGTIRTSYTFTPAVGLNTVNVDVTAEDGTSVKNYSVAITRASQEISNDATLSSLSLTNAALAETFDKTKLAYTSSVPYATTSVTVNTSTTNLAATVKIAGTVRTSYTFTPAVGLNTINIDVTAEDGTTVKNYSVALTRASQGTAPIVTASPASTNFTDSITVTLSVNPSTTIYYTTNGDAPSTSSSVYSSSLTFTSTTTLKTYVVKDSLSDTKTFTYTKGSPSAYYATNPNGQVGKNKTITGLSDWSENMKIAQGAADDAPRAWRGFHETPDPDLYAMFAAWDNTNLYLMVEIPNVDEADTIDNDKSYAGSQFLPMGWAINTGKRKTGTGLMADGFSVWTKVKAYSFANGIDTMVMHHPRLKIGEPSIFTTDDSGYFSYNKTNCIGFVAAGITRNVYFNQSVSTNMWAGVTSSGDLGGKVSTDVNSYTYVDLKAQGKKASAYQITIPLAALGIDKAYLESTGIGVAVFSTYGESTMDVLPWDPSMINKATDAYSKDPSSSAEKEDFDEITAALARIGKL